MKTTLLFLLFSLGLYAQQTPEILGFNGVYYKQGNTTVVNLGWYVPNNQTVYNYIIKRNGAIVKTLQAIGFVQVSITVEREYKMDTFSVVCNNKEYFTTVKK
jgi:hypothetical protein